MKHLLTMQAWLGTSLSTHRHLRRQEILADWLLAAGLGTSLGTSDDRKSWPTGTSGHLRQPEILPDWLLAAGLGTSLGTSRHLGQPAILADWLLAAGLGTSIALLGTPDDQRSSPVGYWQLGLAPL